MIISKLFDYNFINGWFFRKMEKIISKKMPYSLDGAEDSENQRGGSSVKRCENKSYLSSVSLSGTWKNLCTLLQGLGFLTTYPLWRVLSILHISRPPVVVFTTFSCLSAVFVLFKRYRSTCTANAHHKCHTLTCIIRPTYKTNMSQNGSALVTTYIILMKSYCYNIYFMFIFIL